MSDLLNNALIDEAQELIPELAGTGLDEVLESNIAQNDLEALWQHIMEARDVLREE